MLQCDVKTHKNAKANNANHSYSPGSPGRLGEGLKSLILNT